MTTDELWDEMWEDLRHNATGQPTGRTIVAKWRPVIESAVLAGQRPSDRLAALEEFLAASDAVEAGVVDFTLHASAVERLRAARQALR